MKTNKGIVIADSGKAHENKWAVLSAENKKLLASSDDLGALQKKFGNDGVVYTKILPSDTIFAFDS